MSQRLIRDDMLESERVQRRTVPARWLFLAIMLTADDMGLVEYNEFKLARRAALPDDTIAALWDELVKADLIRPYTVAGKRYAFVPRFRQRLRIKRTKHPLPPAELTADDDDALNKINDLEEKCPTRDGHPLADDGLNLNLNLKKNQRKSITSPSETSSAAPTPAPARKVKKVNEQAVIPCPYDEIIGLYHEILPELPRVLLRTAARERALRKTWAWVLTSRLSNQQRRAENREQALGWFRRYFERTSRNDFLMGRTPRNDRHANWKCDLDFLLTERGMRHVIEKTEAAA